MPTTPLGVWTPDDADDWDLTVDLAAMAVSVDTVITDSITSAAGTNANRLSLVEPLLKDGLQFYATDTNTLWRYVAGGWRRAVDFATYNYAANGLPDAIAYSSGGLTAVPLETTSSSFINSVTGSNFTLKAGVYSLGFHVNLNSAVTGRTFVSIYTGSTKLSRANAVNGEDSLATCATVNVPADGGGIKFEVYKQTGALSNLTGRVTLQRIG